MECNKCYGFLVDFISLPADKQLAYYVKSKNIHKVAHELAKEFYHIFKKINPFQQYYIIKKVLYSFDLFNKKKQYISEEHVRGMIKLEGLIELCYKEDIDYIIFILEENNIIIHPDIQLLWIANCIEHIWIHLEQIHNEHTGVCDVSYGGPAVGMKSINIVPEKTQEQKKFDELYN